MNEAVNQDPITAQLPSQIENDHNQESVTVLENQEWRTALDGIKEFVLRTRIAWRHETLHGTSGNSEIKIRGTDVDLGKILDRKPRQGLYDHEKVIQGTAEDAYISKPAKRDQREMPQKRRHQTLNWWRNDRRLNALKREGEAKRLRMIYGEDVTKSKKERRDEDAESPMRRKRIKGLNKASRRHNNLVNVTGEQTFIHRVRGNSSERTEIRYESKSRIKNLSHRYSTKRSMDRSTFSSKIREMRINNLEDKQINDKLKLSQILLKPEKPPEIKEAEKLHRKKKKLQSHTINK